MGGGGNEIFGLNCHLEGEEEHGLHRSYFRICLVD